MAVVNSELEAETLRYLYFNYGPARVQWGRWAYEPPEAEIPPPEITPKMEPSNAIVHIGVHDLFIEGEYLAVYGK